MTSSVFAGDGRVRRAKKPIAGVYVVVLNDDIIDEVRFIIDDLVKSHKVRLISVYDRALKGAAIGMTEQQAAAVSRDPRVKGVWEDAVGEFAGSVSARSWSVDRIDERMSPRLDGNYSYCNTGKGVRVYVVDSGIWGGHDEFSNPDPLTGGTRVPLGYDVNAHFGNPNQSNNPPCGHSDVDGGGLPTIALHGTKVASVVGGRTLGVAPEATLVPVRVTDCSGLVSRTLTLEGLNWIASDPAYTGGGRVVTLSQIMNSGDLDPIGQDPIEMALRNLIGQGMTVVVAAGNSNKNAVADNFVPSRDSALLVVGGSEGRNTTDTDARWYDPTIARGSNYGPSIDLFAPARNVMVALWSSTVAVSNPSDENQSTGTSFAAPAVAGAAARYLEFFPTESHAQIEARLVSNATSDVDGLNLLDRQNSANRLLYMSYGCRQHSCCL